MAVRYYDDAIVKKLNKWIPENSNLRVLKPDETHRLFKLIAEDSNDKPFKMPFIALSRSTSIELLSNIKQERSFNGLRLNNNKWDDVLKTYTIDNKDKTAVFNIIPIKVEYQLDIYTKTYEEGDEYLRTFLFKLINNPVIYIKIPYNGMDLEHIANIRVLSTVSDTSDINEHLFAGQFTRWTIQLEIQDAFLFSIPYKDNWTIGEVAMETTTDVTKPGETEFDYKLET